MENIKLDGFTNAFSNVVGSIFGSNSFFSSKPDIDPSLLQAQSIASQTKVDGESAIYRWPGTPHGEPLHETIGNNKTAYDSFWNIVDQLPDQEFLARAKEGGGFEWFTHKQIANRSLAVGAGLLQMAPVKGSSKNADPVPSQLVGILCKNCPEWLILDYALLTFGLVSVPIHESFDPPGLEYILKHTELSTLAVSVQRLPTVLSVLKNVPHLTTIIILDSDVVPDDAQAKAGSVKILTLQQVESATDKPAERIVPSPEDIFTICYTSGTTGNPKGVMITHKNLVATGSGVIDRIPAHLALGPNDKHLSFLPLSHMLERVISHSFVALGARIGFYRGDVTKLMDDIVEFQPTLFPCVPRLLNRIYDKIVSTVDGGSSITKNLFWYAFAQKKAMLEKGSISRSTFWDTLVFGKVQEKLGGKIRIMLSGAAPIDPTRLTFFRVAFGCDILEGYGQTESCAGGYVTNCGDYNFPYGSHVGVPFSGIEVKLVDAPEMGYRSTDPNPRGEICFRGPMIMKGYYKEPAKTKETIDSDGWLHTGDVGEMEPNGTLRIVDRIKNIYKLAQGEFVAPETLEAKLTNKFATQMYIHGDSLRDFLVAVIAPDMVVLKRWANENGITVETDEEYRKNQKVIDRVIEELKTIGKSAGLKGYEIPRKIVLTDKQLTVENGMLTPTFKAKRHLVKTYFADEITVLYA